MTAPVAAGRRIEFLEWVRGIAAVLVVLEHLGEYVAPDALRTLSTVANPGRVGVVAFFMVSGYVIPLSLERQTIRTFLVRRLYRLYPSYWLCLAAAVVVLAVDGTFSGKPVVLVAAAVVANLTMLQGLVLLPSLLAPAWTLSIEWVFYVQQVLFKARRALPSAWAVGHLWCLGFLALCGVEHVTGIDLPATFALLLAVACLGQAWAAFEAGRLSGRATAGLLADIVVVVPLGMSIGIDGWGLQQYTLSSYVGIALFLGVWCLRGRRGHPALVWLGSISYALYLSHGLVLYPLTHPERLGPWTLTLTSLVLMPLLAWALHVGVERPFIARGRAATGGRREAEPTLPVSSEVRVSGTDENSMTAP